MTAHACSQQTRRPVGSTSRLVQNDRRSDEVPVVLVGDDVDSLILDPLVADFSPAKQPLRTETLRFPLITAPPPYIILGNHLRACAPNSQATVYKLPISPRSIKTLDPYVIAQTELEPKKRYLTVDF